MPKETIYGKRDAKMLLRHFKRRRKWARLKKLKRTPPHYAGFFKENDWWRLEYSSRYRKSRK